MSDILNLSESQFYSIDAVVSKSDYNIEDIFFSMP
jgi:hypothetical protein